MNKQYGNQDPNYYDFGDDPDLKDEPSLDELLEELDAYDELDEQYGGDLVKWYYAKYQAQNVSE